MARVERWGMTLKRRRVKRNERANYPTAVEARANRRRFLKLLGRSLLGASVFGLASCTNSAGKMLVDTKDAGLVEEDWSMAGGMPDDAWDRQDGGGPHVHPDTEDQWPAPGGLEVLVDEEEWHVEGDLTGVDESGTPDPDVVPEIEEEDWNIAGG